MNRLLLLLLASWFLAPAASADTIRLATDGKALHTVVVADKAPERVRQAAKTLADYLGRIATAKFTVSVGDGTTGIVVGRAEDFPALKLAGRFDATDAERREEYYLRSHDKGVWLIGATEQAVEHAVWDLLYRLGHRQYFPGNKWEIVPTQKNLSIDIDTFQRPAYHSRRIWYGFGAWDYAKQPYAEWCAKNRCVQGIALNTGHAYDGIISRNKKAFAQHPEYLALIDGERKGTKFCISDPGLRKLVVEDALAQFASDPKRQSVSIDPSDGGGWCQCPKCAKLGSVSDQAVTLANEVAKSVTAKYPDKYVGMYAYSQHSPPPNIEVHPRVVISVATSFIRGGYTVDQLLDGWSKKAKILGVREYYSVNTWDRDLPARARGGNIEYLCKTIPHFHSKGARFLSAESSDNWGPNGLGYYLAGRMLWDVNEAKRADALIADFLDKCFADAREPMKQFYTLLDSGKKRVLSDDLIGRMYRLLQEARGKTKDVAVLGRIDDLALYVRYVELFFDYSTAEGKERQVAFEKVIRHAYRMRGTMMIHTYALYRDLDARDKSVRIPEAAQLRVAEGKNPWKDSTPFKGEEIRQFLSDGIAKRKLLDFEPVAFSEELVGARALRLAEVKTGSAGLYSRAPRSYYTWIEKAPATIPLTVTAGVIYTTNGPAKVDLYPAAETQGKSVSHHEVTPDKKPSELQLRTMYTGLHRIEVVGGGAATTAWKEGTPMTIESSQERPGGFHGRWTMYFYVPRGTKSIGGFSQGVGVLRDPEGKEAMAFDRKPGYFNVTVRAGQDGKLWKFDRCAGDKVLMTVPPYLARNAAELLLPKEVVTKDSVKE